RDPRELPEGRRPDRRSGGPAALHRQGCHRTGLSQATARRGCPVRHPLLIPDLRELIRDGELAGVRDFVAEHHPGRVAELTEDLEEGDGDPLFRVLPARNRSEVLSYLEPDRQVRLVEAMPAGEAAELIHVMSHDERADLVNRLDEDVLDPVLHYL